MLLIGILGVLILGTLQAQTTAVKIHPLHFFSCKFEVEHQINSNISVGVIGSGMFLAFEGYRIQPYARLYLGADSKVFDGFYAQGKFHYSRVVDNNAVRELIKDYGFSTAFGYQHTFGKHFVIDLYSGYRFSKPFYYSTSESSTMYRMMYSLPMELGISLGTTF